MGNHSENDNNNDPKENKNNINKGQPSDNDKDKKDKDEKPEDININNNQNLEIKNDENINIIKIEKIRRGRKINPDNLDKTQKIHSKYSKDNIMSKLKCVFFRYIFDLIHKQLINKDIRLLKISHRAIIDLAYKGNERLLKMKISDILYEQEISPKYRFFSLYYLYHIVYEFYDDEFSYSYEFFQF